MGRGLMAPKATTQHYGGLMIGVPVAAGPLAPTLVTVIVPPLIWFGGSVPARAPSTSWALFSAIAVSSSLSAPRRTGTSSPWLVLTAIPTLIGCLTMISSRLSSQELFIKG